MFISSLSETSSSVLSHLEKYLFLDYFQPKRQHWGETADLLQADFFLLMEGAGLSIFSLSTFTAFWEQGPVIVSRKFLFGRGTECTDT